MRNLTPKFSNGDGAVTVRGRKRKIYCILYVFLFIKLKSKLSFMNISLKGKKTEKLGKWLLLLLYDDRQTYTAINKSNKMRLAKLFDLKPRTCALARLASSKLKSLKV